MILRRLATIPRCLSISKTHLIGKTYSLRCFHSIPKVDISPFVNETPHSRSLKEKSAKDLHKACCEVGFAYISGHGVSEELLKKVLENGHKLFALPQATKEKFAMSYARGYQTLGLNITDNMMDMHEGFDLYREYDDNLPIPIQNQHLRQKNKWPSEQDLPGFKHVMNQYIAEMLKLGDTVMRVIATGLGLEEQFFQRFSSESHWVMRVIGYPTPRELTSPDKHNIGCGEHTDYGCLTFINQDLMENSLQVKNTNGEWISADPIEGALVMNIGDMLNVWTNGLYQSTPHRVMRPTSASRVSTPFFFEPDFNAIVKPLDVCLKNQSPKFKPIMYGEHLLSKINTNFVA